MRPLAAHGQARPFQMPHGDLQHRVVRAVINGQRAADLRDFDNPHHAVAGGIEQAFIFPLLLFRQSKDVFPL